MHRLVFAALAAIASAACGSTTPEAASTTAEPTTPPATAAAAASASAAPSEPPPKAPPRFATRDKAGADTCKVALHPLDAAYFIPGMATDVIAGFGARGGLAAFSAPDKRLGVRALDATGKPRASTITIQVPDKFSPKHVVAFDGGFLVIGDLYEFSHMRAAAVATDESGKPLGSAVELDLEHRYIHDISPANGHEIVILATRALMVPSDKESLPGKWLAIKIGADGKLEQKSADLPMAFPLIRVFDVVFPLELDRKPAWYIRRGGEPTGELVRDAKIQAVAKEDLGKHGIKPEQLESPDEVDWAISFGPQGSVFERMHAGAALGKGVELPPGLSITVQPAWTGTAWVFGYSSQIEKSATAHLAVVDCR
jgi:hypothetical protein